ncbi:MAG TPA: amidohydrolase, partial [Candidatus Sumerlaeota bacterium]|nr:amidohydrolase [Candidatus Sumerlaeota bacterium]
MYAIDVHAHVFPDNIADKAVALLAGEASYPARGTGTMSDLEQRMDASGVRASVLLAVATRV